jgi:hypothetical protein
MPLAQARKRDWLVVLLWRGYAQRHILSNWACHYDIQCGMPGVLDVAEN